MKFTDAEKRDTASPPRLKVSLFDIIDTNLFCFVLSLKNYAASMRSETKKFSELRLQLVFDYLAEEVMSTLVINSFSCHNEQG